MEKEKSIIKAGQHGLALNNIEDMFRYGQYLVASGLAPASFKTPESVVIALQTGAELGLHPQAAMRSLAVIQGKATLYGDAALSLVRRSGFMTSFKEEILGQGEQMKAVCTVSRGKEKVVEEFSVQDAKQAKLWGKSGPWTSHPKRMLKYKARSFALRDLFSDVLMGMHTFEEFQGEEVMQEQQEPKIVKARVMDEPAMEIMPTDEAAPEAVMESVTEAEPQKAEFTEDNTDDDGGKDAPQGGNRWPF